MMRSGFSGTMSRIGSRGPITAPTVVTLRSTTSPEMGAAMRCRTLRVLGRAQPLAQVEHLRGGFLELACGLLHEVVAQARRLQFELDDLLPRLSHVGLILAEPALVLGQPALQREQPSLAHEPLVE